MTRAAPTEAEVARALAQFPELAGGAAEPLAGGLINATFAVEAAGARFVLQRIHPVFAPEIHQKRLDTWPEHYPWIDKEGYFYFRKRLAEARRDVQFALNFTLDHYRTREQQERALDILQFKLDVLWSMLDSMQVNLGIGPRS